MSVDIDVEGERTKFIAAIGDADRTGIARLAADLEVDRILRNTAAEGDVTMTAAEQAELRELLRTVTLDSAALLGLIPPPSQSQLARLDDFLAFREAAKRAAPRVTAASSSSALH
jgi:hypothetical protein